jgi:DNA modification methylase
MGKVKGLQSVNKWPADHVERRSVESLIPYARNARTHSDEQVAQIAASIKEWGWTTPVLVDETGQIIAGHGRVMAARKLGIEEIPVMVATGWTEAQRRAYVLADNQLAANAGWDMDLLKVELGDLGEAGFDLDLIGFDDKMLAGLLAEETEGLTDEDAVPEAPEEPVTVLGDIWALRNHRLMCGDSTSMTAFSDLMGGAQADMIFTDPPYGMSYGGGRAAGSTKKGALVKAHGMIINDDLQGDDLIALVRDAIATSTACMKKGGALYACFTWRTYSEFEAGLESCGHKVKACIVWDKKSIGLGNSNYRPQHEFIFYCGGQWYGDKSQSDVWYMSRGSTGEYVHPTQKPVELIERALLNSSKAGDVVIDCFGGSGSTLIACEKNGRNSYLMELDPKYCDVIIKRWQDFTGQEAVHAETGKTFNEMSNARKTT